VPPPPRGVPFTPHKEKQKPRKPERRFAPTPDHPRRRDHDGAGPDGWLLYVLYPLSAVWLMATAIVMIKRLDHAVSAPG
jgi:hypothetical protein